jgi:phospholipid transport system substrate-binding protein
MQKSDFSPRGAVLASFLAATLWLAGGSQLAEADLLALPVAAPPSGVAPDVLLRTVTADVLAILKRDAEAGDVTKITELVEAKILPFFDFAQMTRIAMGRNWSAASPEQQSALVAQFRTLLVRTYSMSLVSYRDQVVEYLPLHAGAGDTDVTVRSTVKRPGAERMTIDYDMEKTRAGWTVYDVKVAGVSLVVTYRASFAAEVRDNGVPGLIKVLTERNRQNQSRPGAGKA